jgi:hypothetical protein
MAAERDRERAAGQRTGNRAENLALGAETGPRMQTDAPQAAGAFDSNNLTNQPACGPAATPSGGRQITER